jgi:hypothetical protein
MVCWRLRYHRPEHRDVDNRSPDNSANLTPPCQGCVSLSACRINIACAITRHGLAPRQVDRLRKDESQLRLKLVAAADQLAASEAACAASAEELRRHAFARPRAYLDFSWRPLGAAAAHLQRSHLSPHLPPSLVGCLCSFPLLFRVAAHWAMKCPSSASSLSSKPAHSFRSFFQPLRSRFTCSGFPGARSGRQLERVQRECDHRLSELQRRSEVSLRLGTH